MGRPLEPTVSQQLIEEIEQIAIFGGVGLEAISHCLDQCSIREFTAGHVLIEPSRDERVLYIVLEGRLEARLNNSPDSPSFAIEQGSCAGEMSMIENTTPSATVTTTQATRVLCIEENLMWRLINISHSFAMNLLVTLSKRLRFDNDYIVNSNHVLTQYMRNSITDSLTDLNNRRWMRRMFTRKIKRAKQQQSTNICLAILDLDHFKSFNDSYGHPVGDLILQRVSSGLRDFFRPTDLIARFGGDEFIVMLPRTDIIAGKAICQRVLEGMNHRLENLSQTYEKVTISIGVTKLRVDDTLDTIIDRADQALYRAKLNGRNRVVATNV